MTPNEHRREAATLLQENPDDPEAQGRAAAHMQIAKALEIARMPNAEIWPLCFLAGVGVLCVLWSFGVFD